jgi:hypothetical protein
MSAVGTFRTSREVRRESAMSTKTESAAPSKLWVHALVQQVSISLGFIDGRSCRRMINSSACCGPAAAIHLQIARRPNAGCPDDEGEDRILGSMLADQSGEMLRMDRLAAGLSCG